MKESEHLSTPQHTSAPLSTPQHTHLEPELARGAIEHGALERAPREQPVHAHLCEKAMKNEIHGMEGVV